MGKRYWVYEYDTFMVGFGDCKPEITPKKKFLFKFMAVNFRDRMQQRMSLIGDVVTYIILEADKKETFKEAYKRENGVEL
jgi:hypothetical protein